MSIQRKPIRGMQDIRTHASKASAARFQPHEAYMRLTCLEMEKARRSKEKESAVRRVRQIEARFKEIEDEKKQLLNALAAHDGDTTALIVPRSSHGKRQGETGCAVPFKVHY